MCVCVCVCVRGLGPAAAVSEGMKRAKDLRVAEKKASQGTVSIQIVRAEDLLAADGKERGKLSATSDPYCDVYTVGMQGKSTKVVKGTSGTKAKELNPEWKHDVPEIVMDETMARAAKTGAVVLLPPPPPPPPPPSPPPPFGRAFHRDGERVPAD